MYILKETVLLYAAEVTLQPGALSKLMDTKQDDDNLIKI